MIGNGALGSRGTLEEFTRDERAAITVAGLYDQVPGCWRELVNAPNAFFSAIRVDGQVLSPRILPPTAHRQMLDLREAVLRRETRFGLASGASVEVQGARFLSAADVQLGVAWQQITADRDLQVIIETGIDGNVWDINGPHLTDHEGGASREDELWLAAKTQERGIPLTVAVAFDGDFRRAHCTSEVVRDLQRVLIRTVLNLKANEAYSWLKFFSVTAGSDAVAQGRKAATAARALGFDALLARHRTEWSQRWARSDIQVDGDDVAQLALRHSVYQLLLATPAHSERTSIPARGLSGQVYKGAVFWDTEMFMLPFFEHTQPEMARSLLRYRFHTLDGARRKASEFGYRGAFYAWESQETGDDACSFFNVTDVFTGRPMRTYFRDKQVHISADVALAIWRYFQHTADAVFLVEGGAEIILECARFYLSLAGFVPDRNRYEIRDVVGPDEYHERVDNNAFTSALARETVRVALQVLAWLETERPDAAHALTARLNFTADIGRLRDVADRLFVPEPDAGSKVIEQFSGYLRLEDASVSTVKSRVLNPTEYWGGGNGVATQTQVIKQADTVLLLHLFAERYATDVRRANWEYYEPRTEHGSSLSACVYAMVAAGLGKVDWAYRYFLKTATIDLTGDSKQYVGPLFIGGTHPAANGGAWMTAVLGFAGLRCHPDGPSLRPHLPRTWTQLGFRFCWRELWFSVRVTPTAVKVTADAANQHPAMIDLDGVRVACAPGETVAATNREDAHV